MMGREEREKRTLRSEFTERRDNLETLREVAVAVVAGAVAVGSFATGNNVDGVIGTGVALAAATEMVVRRKRR